MAVFQGVRQPGVAIGARGVPTARPRAGDPGAGLARPRVRPAAVLILVVLAAAALAFAYLTQTLASTATSLEISQLQNQASELTRHIRTQGSLVRSEATLGSVRERAVALGLSERDSITVQAP